jgi:hypothetical protein
MTPPRVKIDIDAARKKLATLGLAARADDIPER